MAYKISIIVPVYNAADFVADAFASLRAQTIGFDALQVLFVDDCSTDNSKEILTGWAEEFDNVFVYSTIKNSGGAAGPRNVGLAHVSAPYVMFLDNDDYYEPDACALLYEEALQSDADLVSGYFRDVTSDKKHLNEKTPACPLTGKHVFTLPEQLLDAQDANVIFWCKIYKASLIEAAHLRFYEDTQMEDTVFFTAYLLHCKSMVYLDNLIYNFRARASISRTLNARYLTKHIRGYAYLHTLYSEAGRMDCFDYNVRVVPDYFVPRFFTSEEIEPEQQQELLQKWQWLVQYVHEHALFASDEIKAPLLAMTAYNELDAAVAYGRLYAKYDIVGTMNHNNTIQLAELRARNQAQANLYLALQTDYENARSDLFHLNQQLLGAQQSIAEIRASRSYRIGSAMLSPLHMLHRKS
ncbi:MAG: glycosyltransferase family 2 protein [Ruthenibacterium sp.]